MILPGIFHVRKISATMSEDEGNEVITEDLVDRCSKASKFFQNKFPDVPQMSWNEFYRLQGIQCEPLVNKPTASDVDEVSDDISSNLNSSTPFKLALIDVRSTGEYDVSTIPGAVSLATFQNDIVHNLAPDANVVGSCLIC